MKQYLPWINIGTALVALAVNLLATTLPLNGQTTAAISDKFQVLFVPAGYVFAIWGIIYVGWMAFAVYQALPAQRANPRLQRISWLFALANIANAAWLFTWHFELFPLSAIVMLSLLALLIAIYWRLNIGRVQVSAREKWLVDLPFGIYLGWISVATIANISDLLYYWHWDGFGISPELWAVIMLVIAAAIALAMALTRAEVAYLLVIVWAFVGIAVKQSATPMVANTALVMAALVVLMIPFGLWRRRNNRMRI
ncbi:MAG TPA: tryptophan-rich sensory protein [Anaerolineae bacterium]